MPKKRKELTVLEPVEPLIRELRGERVIFDSDLARIYGVPTFRFNEAVKRNQDRFPADFRFQLTPVEFDNLISQIAISSSGHGGRRKLPWAFTEHGAIMAASVLNTPRAIQVNTMVVEAFVAMRQIAAKNPRIAKQLKLLEQKIGDHDESIQKILFVLKQLTEPIPAERPKRKIGFNQTGDE